MTSRDRILEALRAPVDGDAGPRGQVVPLLPELPGESAPSPHLDARFAASLEAAGGKAWAAAGTAAVEAGLQRICGEAGLTRVASIVPGLRALAGLSMLDIDAVADPHDLTDVDLAVVPGRFAVAENGAVWVSGADLRQRALCFTCQHLALVVPADQLVATMHDAYRRQRVDEAPFGVFISGPSKTADIEQALVLGAHGPRSLAVFLVGSPFSATG